MSEHPSSSASEGGPVNLTILGIQVMSNHHTGSPLMKRPDNWPAPCDGHVFTATVQYRDGPFIPICRHCGQSEDGTMAMTLTVPR